MVVRLYGERHGKGKLVIEQSGEWYEGDWRDGDRSQTLSDFLSFHTSYEISGTDVPYAGTRNGYGTMQHRSGNVYVGQWKDG